MFLPRRRQRRLLLPPGWLALGFLLLLGCLALLTHERQLKQPTVIQLTMPPLKPDKSDIWLTAPAYKPVDKLNVLRPWHDTDFVGTPLNDFVNAKATQIAIRAINADSSHAGGVRIRLQQGATYGNLVNALDIMNIENQKKYWLDIRHQPITLYAVTDKALPPDSVHQQMFVCGTRDYEIPAPAEVLSLKQLVESLWQHAWRPSVLLLAALSNLSIYRLSSFRQPAR
jgi:hypothetical protein